MRTEQNRSQSTAPLLKTFCYFSIALRTHPTLSPCLGEPFITWLLSPIRISSHSILLHTHSVPSTVTFFLTLHHIKLLSTLIFICSSLYLKLIPSIFTGLSPPTFQDAASNVTSSERPPWSLHLKPKCLSLPGSILFTYFISSMRAEPVVDRLTEPGNRTTITPAPNTGPHI